MDKIQKIRDVATKYDITARTLRYYEDIGLLHSVRSDDYAYRMYDETALKRLEQILVLRKLNISVRDIQRIFNASGSDVVLDVLGKKAQTIDDEIALLHELKEIVLDFINEIEQMDFGSDANVKRLYDKAKIIESHLTNVDYVGKPSNVSRLLDVTQKMEDLRMINLRHPVEKHIQTITYKRIEFDIVERPDVIWAGCVDYATNNTDESNIGATFNRFNDGYQYPGTNGVKMKINPDYSGVLSINYGCNDKPCGLMFANETYSCEQDERWDILTQPGGLWLRVRMYGNAAEALFGRDKVENYEYFAGDEAPLQSAARENGYMKNPDVDIVIEYNNHAVFDTPFHANYAYIPIVRL